MKTLKIEQNGKHRKYTNNWQELLMKLNEQLKTTKNIGKLEDDFQKALETYEKRLKATTSTGNPITNYKKLRKPLKWQLSPPPDHMKSYEKLLKAIKSMRSVIPHMKWYGMYGKLWKHTYIYIYIYIYTYVWKAIKSEGVPQAYRGPLRPLTAVKLWETTKIYKNNYKSHKKTWITSNMETHE